MNKLTKSDLLYQAQSLPKVEPFDHEDMVIRNYETNGWDGVMEYCSVIRSIASLETPRDTISSKWTYYLSKTKSLLTGLINRLKQIELR